MKFVFRQLLHVKRISEIIDKYKKEVIKMENKIEILISGEKVIIDTERNIAIIKDKEYKIMYHYSTLNIGGDTVYIHFHNEDSTWLGIVGDIHNDVVVPDTHRTAYNSWTSNLTNNQELEWTEQFSKEVGLY